MKSQQKIDKVIENLGLIEWTKDLDAAKRYAAESKKLLREFIADNMPNVGKTELKCKDFVETNKQVCQYRPYLQYVFHDSERKVAVTTDLHFLFASEMEYIETEGNGIRDVYGEITEDTKNAGKFPNWSAVMPKDTVPVTIREDLEDALKDAMAAAKMEGKNCGAIVCVDGIHWMNAKGCKFIIKAGTEGFEAQKTMGGNDTDYTRPMYKKWGGKQLLLMPYLAPDDLSDEDKQRGWYVSTKR